MNAGKVIALVFGSLFLLIGVGLLIGGGTLVGVDQVMTDEDGFLSTPNATLERDTYAITGHVVLEGDWIWWWRNPSRVRIEMRGNEPLFVGIGPRSDVEAYLADVSYAEIDEVEFRKVRGNRVWTTEYRESIGSSTPAPPEGQSFWAASVQGEGAQTLEWALEPGDWLFVAMNVDGSRGLTLDGSIGIEAPWLLSLGIGLLAGGLLFLGIGLVLVLVVARTSREAIQSAAEGPGDGGGYPVTVSATRTEPLSPALWLVKWFLLIPHLIVLPFLWTGCAVSWLLSLFAILFTGRYPRGLFDYNVGVLRWTWRVGYYSYLALGTDQYPPFTLRAGGYPADLHVVYPERLSPGLALVKWWLLALPHYLIVSMLQGGASFFQLGLSSLLTLFAGVHLLFTGRYPDDLFRLIVGMNRWSLRVVAYAALMTDEYPPFRLEE